MNSPESNPDPSNDQPSEFEVVSRSIVRTKLPDGAHCRFRIAPDGHLEIDCDLHGGRRALIHILEQMLREAHASEPEPISSGHGPRTMGEGQQTIIHGTM